MKQFIIGVDADVVLGLPEIWPDDDAPENPSAETVAEVMRGCGSLRRVLEDWMLLDELRVTVHEHGVPGSVDVWGPS